MVSDYSRFLTNALPENWETPQRILVILAHPDDPEFFCGATIARWTHAGHLVIYMLLTCGDKGTKDPNMNPRDLCNIRQAEQIEAAKLLGVESVHFMHYPDGYLEPNIELRRDVTRVIRQFRPDILVTCDPTNLYIDNERLNHPDHRAAGQVVLDAVFPAARDHLYFIELLEVENLNPHIVKEVWVCAAQHPNLIINVTNYWDKKIKAILKHKSQISDPMALVSRINKRFLGGGNHDFPQYEEKFIRLILA